MVLIAPPPPQNQPNPAFHRIEPRSHIIRIFNITLLDLRGAGAMKAGSVAALSTTDKRQLSQEWSRYFYEQENIYSTVDGLIYCNAHNNEEAIALYERSMNGLVCPDNIHYEIRCS